MAEQNQASGVSPFNLNSILALLTLAGSVWFVSQKLTSDRPVAQAGGAREFPGEQTLEARLWEDPFKRSEDLGPCFETLVEQIKRRSQTTNAVLLLPVMLSGGQYTEDQESRIRSRFAIVSALGRSGYAPADAEHIGSVKIPWPTQNELELKKTNAQHLWTREDTKSPLQCDTNNLPLGMSTRFNMELHYEWYLLEPFSTHVSAAAKWTDVLVLWLDDSFFEDEPLLRLPLLFAPLLAPLTNSNRHVETNLATVALIGPRRSSTLRAMLLEAGAWPAYANLSPELTIVLKQVRMYCATPSAMDEVLLDVPPDEKFPQGEPRPKNPRESVEKKLTNIFESFQNFAATDAQLAKEMFEELALRGVELKDTQNHVVLISEWDTFYARVLSLTYQAELAIRQGSTPSRAKFARKQNNEGTVTPGNFHSFVYLRGLDGQTVGGDSGSKGATPQNDRAAKAQVTSIEDLRKWIPDENKAVGQAQFDYLSRLGDQMDNLEGELHRKGKGHIEAVGIVGSDVYDTLLILQAIRRRFPNSVFFTTDLDARFCHPREREWARNLIVASPYGLALHPDLQKDVAPFRDSSQTAQFAAALAALGNANFDRLTNVPPRRFEIGSRTAMDLSVTNAMLATVDNTGMTNTTWLHPETLSLSFADPHGHIRKRLWAGLGLALLALIGACWQSHKLRHFTVDGIRDACEPLNYSEEDIGGPDGAEVLLGELYRNPDSICRWMVSQQFHPLSPMDPWTQSIAQSPPEAEPGGDAQSREAQLQREKHVAEHAGTFIRLLNEMLHGKIPHDLKLADAMTDTRLIPCDVACRARFSVTSSFGWNPIRRLIRRRRARRFLDALLQKLDESWFGADSHAHSPQADALQAATAARRASIEIFRVRRKELICFCAGAIGLAVTAWLLGHDIWFDTFHNPQGEGFSLVSGTSAWPAEILRLIVFACAVSFSFGLYHRMREGFFSLTRKFRLSLPAAEPVLSGNRVSALTVWKEYGARGQAWQRLKRIALLVPTYVVLCLALKLLFDQDILNPVRGERAQSWNKFLLLSSMVGFLFLAFLTIDAARLCGEFIRKLSRHPTAYPDPTCRHFSRERGNVPPDYLDEWIDLQLIADLTERVGKLVYYPSALLLLLILARNSWWDRWSWPTFLVVIFILNLGLALVGVVIVQRTAREAKRTAEASLIAKVKKLQFRAAKTIEENQATQAEQLLDEIRQLRRGAFVPFWQNPVLGAILLPSGGATILNALILFLGR